MSKVPNTKIVKLKSTAFYYSKVQKLAAKAAKPLGKRVRQGLPLKVGSLQTFVMGFRDAKEEMEKIDWKRLPG